MATIKKWEHEIENLEKDQMKIYLKSLNNLMAWEFFREQFKDFGLNTIGVILSSKIAEKEKQKRT